MNHFAGLEHVVREQQPLAPFTWFRLGGEAQYFAEPTNQAELLQLLRQARGAGLPVRLLGGGSRVLVNDRGVEGLVIHLSAPDFATIRVQGNRIVAGGGAQLGHVVSTAVREGLAGLEPLVGIPGTVAGAIRGNADSHGTSIGQWIDRVRVITDDDQVADQPRDALRFGYGESSVDEPVVLEAELLLETGDPAELTRRMQKIWILKRAAQPTGRRGTGRIFKDPRGLSAADLIEEAGMRGASVGKARICERSANFVEVEPDATSDDVRQLIDLVGREVADKTGVHLEREIEFW